MKQKTKKHHVQAYVRGMSKTDFDGYESKFVIAEDVLDMVIKASCLPTEEDGRKWAKWVDSIDRHSKDGWCFIGEFIKSGTVELPIGKPKLILVQSSIRDKELRSGWLRQFRVVKMDPDGKTFYPTHIATDDRRGGWALRIRDLTENMLRDMNYTVPPDDRSRFSMVEL